MNVSKPSARTGIGRFFHRFFFRGVVPLLVGVGCACLALLIFALSVSTAVCIQSGESIQSPSTLEQDAGQFDCILVLGCAVYENGTMSNMLQDRVDVGISLYQMGVSTTILMSGDNRDVYYNEVGPMRAAALEAGIPEEHIEVDRYGLSTYESLYRAIYERGYRKILIVTQQYHLYRAVYVAEKLGAEAVGVSADRRTYRGQWKRNTREVLARCKDVLYGLVQPEVQHPNE